MQNKPTRKKKNFLPGATKALLALTSVAGTVGLWNVISNQSLVEAQKASNTIDGNLEFSPIPTVIPLARVNLEAALNQDASSNLPFDKLRMVTLPATTQAAPAARRTATAPSGSSSGAPVVSDPVQSAPVVTDPPANQPPAETAAPTPAPTAVTGSSK